MVLMNNWVVVIPRTQCQRCRKKDETYSRQIFLRFVHKLCFGFCCDFLFTRSSLIFLFNSALGTRINPLARAWNFWNGVFPDMVF